VGELDWIVYQLLTVVERYHRRGIIHRNITPKSIYIKTNEIIVNSLGTNDFLKEIRIYEADEYLKTYFAPEIVLHDGKVGTWTDVYALGKIIANLVEALTKDREYAKGLNILTFDRRHLYETVIQSCVLFDTSERLADAMTVKKVLFEVQERRTTSKMMVGAIALIAFVSSVMVLWQFEAVTLTSNVPENENYIEIPDEETPLGDTIGIKNEFFFITDDESEFIFGEEALIEWFHSGAVDLKSIRLESLDGKVDKQEDLSNMNRNFDLNTIIIKDGMYRITIYYSIDKDDFESSIDINIVE
jgi:serine/threonine protein kinase